MTASPVLERNLLALAASDPALGARMSRTAAAGGVAMQNSRTGLAVPTRSTGSRSLAYHSLVDPEREAQRVCGASRSAGYLVFLGLGGGYQVRPFLSLPEVSRVVVLEPEPEFVRAVLERIDLRQILLDRRVRLCIGPDLRAVREFLLADYLPAVHGDLRTVPLRSSVEADPAFFRGAIRCIQEVIELVADDYTVQARFGQKWFTNTLNNLQAAQDSVGAVPPVHRAIVTGAGPSLELQLEGLSELRQGARLIASDTSLPALLARGIQPDLVISIDCQQISYHHFLQGIPPDVPLVLDLASPGVLTRLTPNTLFFSSGHPFSRYVSQRWRQFPLLDTSGGNVSHAAVSLAGLLGAREIYLAGMDFSYPRGKAYSRETYLYPLFRSSERRLRPLETLLLDFILKNSSIRTEPLGDGIGYTTRQLSGYRERLEHSLEAIPSRIIQLPGHGVPLRLPRGGAGSGGAAFPAHDENWARVRGMFAAGPPKNTWREFLRGYRRDLKALPKPHTPPAGYFMELDAQRLSLWATLLPAAAALRERYPELRPQTVRLLRAVLDWSVEAVSRALDR